MARIRMSSPVDPVDRLTQQITELKAEVAELQRVGRSAWQAYAPGMTQWGLGNGTLRGGYQQVGAITWVEIVLTVGSTTAKSGDPQFTLPFPVHTSFDAVSMRSTIFATHYDQTGGSFTAPCYQVGPQGCRPMVLISNTGVNVPVGNGNSSPTVPFTWTNPDILAVAGWYRHV